MSLFAELSRRNVIRIAGFYLVAAWLVVQVAETVLPAFDVPGWVLRALILVLAIGFVPALVFAWVFELTPDGIRREKPAESAEAGSHRTARKLDIAVIVLLLGIGGLMLWKPGAPEPAASAGPAPSSPAPAESADSSASVAVLAFANMSPDAENEYFADGISEELLNLLSRVDGLRVASRTSAFSFKGKATPIPEIAQALDVRHVLEGSVRKQGQRVRITAQLIDSQTDGHLWSQTYDRELADIFAVQEEIAQAIAGELQDVLGVREVSVSAPTDDLQAYERFLRGRTRFYRRVELDDAIADLRFAVERDPEFTEAWAYLGAASQVVGGGGYPTGLDRQELFAGAQEAAGKALSLDPGLATALAVQGQIFVDQRSTGKWIEGLALLEQAADLSTTDTSARLWLGLAWLQLGYVELAQAHLERAQARDPLVAINNGWLGAALAARGQWEEGARLAQRAFELSRLPFWSNLVGVGLASGGRKQEARPMMEAWFAATPAEGYDPELGPALVAKMLDAMDDAAGQASFFAATDVLEPSARSEVFLTAGLLFQDAERVFGHLDDPSMSLRVAATAWLPSMGWLREHPRFFAMMEEDGIVGFWEQRGYPTGCRPVDDPAGRRLDCSGYGR